MGFVFPKHEPLHRHRFRHPVHQGFTAADAQAVLPPQGVIDVSGFQVDWNNPEAATQNQNSSDTGTQDFSAEGMEIEIAYNPTPNWTILATIAHALMFTLVENCKLAKINPETYLADVLARIDDYPASRIIELTPQGWAKSHHHAGK